MILLKTSRQTHSCNYVGFFVGFLFVLFLGEAVSEGGVGRVVVVFCGGGVPGHSNKPASLDTWTDYFYA